MSLSRVILRATRQVKRKPSTRWQQYCCMVQFAPDMGVYSPPSSGESGCRSLDTIQDCCYVSVRRCVVYVLFLFPKDTRAFTSTRILAQCYKLVFIQFARCMFGWTLRRVHQCLHAFLQSQSATHRGLDHRLSASTCYVVVCESSNPWRQAPYCVSYTSMSSKK